MQTSVVLYPLTNYTFGTKEALVDEEPSMAGKIAKLQTDYATQGMRTTVEAVLLVHDHSHPHILMLQQGPNFFKLFVFPLFSCSFTGIETGSNFQISCSPSGSLIPGEEDVQGLKRILGTILGPEQGGSLEDWDIGEAIGVWWRPHFETFQVFFFTFIRFRSVPCFLLPSRHLTHIVSIRTSRHTLPAQKR